VTAIVAALIGAGVTFGALVLAIKLLSHLGRGTQAIVTRFMGLIVASMGNAIRIGRPESVLSHLGSSASLTDTDFG
jgi:small neutral amino acid transporter SnatA (MarC family)